MTIVLIQLVDRKKAKLGIASYLDTLFKENEKIVSDAAKLKARYQYNMQEKKQLYHRVPYLEKNYLPTRGKILTEDISQTLQDMFSTHYLRFGEKRIGKEISDVLFSSNFMNGIVKDELMRRVTLELKHTFSPQRFLKGFDITSGSLNLSAADMIRTHVEGVKKARVGLIPSSSCIKRVAAKLAAYVDELVPFDSFETETGEGIRFHVPAALRLLLGAYSLSDEAKLRKIGMSLASDGAKITNNILQVVAGVKVNDVAAKCQLTKNCVSPQRQNICWPLLFVMGQENTEMYDTHIEPLYSWFVKATKADESGNCKNIPDIKPLNITSTNDMSATWKMLRKGSTAKVKESFCHCCDCTSTEIAHNNQAMCKFCTNFVEDRPVWQNN